MDVAVEELTIGRGVQLLNGRIVRVTAIDRFGDVTIVRWGFGQTYRRPHKLAGEREVVGSFRPCRAGETVSVRRLGRVVA